MSGFCFPFAAQLFLLGVILFTEDEGSRIKGRRLALSDVIGNSLQWKPFNGSWINGKQLK